MKKTLFLIGMGILASTLVLAGVAGEWDFTATTSDGNVLDLTLTLKEADGKLTGTLGSYEGSVPLDKVKLEGDKLTFELWTDGGTYTSELIVKGDEMTGTFEGDNGSSGTLEAKRAK